MDIATLTLPYTKRYGLKEGYRRIREAGFEAIDWGLYQGPNRRDFAASEDLAGLSIFEKELPEIRAHFAEELAEIRANGLRFAQCHAPFPPYIPGRPDVLEYSIRILRRLIEFCQEIGCLKIIVHGISLQKENMTDTQEDIDRLNRHLYESLIEVLQKTDVVICLENLFTHAGDVQYVGVCGDPHEAAEEIDRLNALAGKKCFGFCLDTGHLQLAHIRFHRYIPILGDRLVALHIHDNDAIHDSHSIPYFGTVLWDEFYTELKKIGYDHDLSFESVVRTDSELVPTFLKLTYDIGDFFKKKITE
ncbi:MAG: TIM barrel protein [Clostridia bacterium]|nr:TIM barrel protein [Clostridia bacterium]